MKGKRMIIGGEPDRRPCPVPRRIKTGETVKKQEKTGKKDIFYS